MADEQQKNNPQDPQPKQEYVTGGGSTAPISSVGMSPAERVQYIQEIQRTSPISKVAEAIKKNLSPENFGLSKAFFDNQSRLFKGIKDTYQKIVNSGKGSATMNQHIAGLTENVRGKERFKHELTPGANVDLLDQGKVQKEKGLYVESDWTPKQKGKVE